MVGIRRHVIQPAPNRRAFGHQHPPLAPDTTRQFFDQVHLRRAPRLMFLDQRRQQCQVLGFTLVRQHGISGQDAMLHGVEAREFIAPLFRWRIGLGSRKRNHGGFRFSDHLSLCMHLRTRAVQLVIDSIVKLMILYGVEFGASLSRQHDIHWPVALGLPLPVALHALAVVRVLPRLGILELPLGVRP